MTKPTTKTAPNPRILRALKKQEILGSDLAPVDTSNTNIPSTHPLPDLPNIKKESGPFKAGKRSVSYKLRYLFKSLLHWKEKRPGYKISFATVHFSRQTEAKLTKAKKGSVSAYGDKLSYALSKLDHETMFFFVLEKGKTTNKRLHAHILIAYHPNDFDTLESVLRKGANTSGTGLKIQDTYKLKHSAKPGTDMYENLEEELAKGICMYHKNKQGEFFIEVPVDGGSVDYISKDLAKRVITKTKHPYYASQSHKKLAAQLWDEAREKQKELEATAQ